MARKRKGAAPSKKRRRREIPDRLEPSMHITDLDNDCLEHIFKKLDLQDLMNVADSSKHSKQAADQAFVSKYGRKEVLIHYMSIPDDGIRISNGKWDIYGPHSLRFLRCFGNLITKLFHTHYTFPENLCLEVERYINKYCSDSLIDINFQKLWSLGEILKRPYFKAETVTFDTLRFDGHLPDIDKCFPSIRRLILKTVTPLPNMVCHSPNLEHLTINQSIGQWPEGSNRTVAAFMALNPQLRSFCLRTSHGGLDANVLLCASKNLQNLESLKFSYSRGSFDIPKGRTIHFKSVKKLDLEFTFSVGALPIMPFLFDQLEEFVFGIRFFAVNQNFMDFISKHPGILKLKISGINNNIVMIQTNKIKLAKLLPSLIELDLAHCTFSVDEVIQFVSELKRLKKFRFKFAQQIFCDTLSELLNDEWTLTQSVGRVVELLKIEKPEMEAEVHPQNVENQVRIKFGKLK